MAKFYIYKGERPSDGARNLAEALDAVMLKSEGSTFRGRPGSVLINWGMASAEAHRLYDTAPVGYNDPNQILQATNKRRFFERLAAQAPGLTVPYVTTYDEATALVRNGGRVYARTVLNGHSGEGIHLMLSTADMELKAIRPIREHNTIPVHVVGGDEAPVALRTAQLFTQGVIGKRTEYRIHIFGGRPILTQVKLRRQGAQDHPGYNSLIRNLASGWIYGVHPGDGAAVTASQTAAIEAMEAVRLDFGAVDVVYQEDTQRAYVLEINTAPGLGDDGSSLKAYSEAFQGAHE